MFAPARDRLFVAVGLTVVAVVHTAMVHRFAFTGDDAWISFRYAQNLLAGNGLVYNPGERVEGMTNLLWVLLVAAGMAVGLSPDVVAHALGVLASAVVLGLLVVMSAREHGRLAPLAVAAPLGLVLTRAFAGWSTSGLETMGFTAAVLAGLVATARAPERAGGPGAALAWGTACLLRPEGLLFAGLALTWAAVDNLRARRGQRGVVQGALAVGAVVAALTLLRLGYYGDVVPNTARAKVTGWRLDQGLLWLAVADEDLALRWWAPLALVPALLRRGHLDVLLTITSATYLAWVLGIGGDRFEQRFLVPVLPALAWLAVEGAALLTRPLGRHRSAVLVPAGVALAALLSTRATAPVRSIRDEVESVVFIGNFADRRLAQGARLRALVQQGLLPADTRLCVGAAGALPYASGLWSLDYFGLNDREIAARPPAPGRRIIAHEKRATADDIVGRGVTMFDGSGHMMAKDLDEATDAWRDLAEKFSKTAGAHKALTRRCHRADGTWLVFANGLTPEAHAARFGHLPDCTAAIEQELAARRARAGKQP